MPSRASLSRPPRALGALALGITPKSPFIHPAWHLALGPPLNLALLSLERILPGQPRFLSLAQGRARDEAVRDCGL